MFTIRHRYVLTSVLSTSVVAMLFVGFIFYAGNMLKDVLGYVLDGRLSIWTFLELSWLMVQYVAMYAVPMGVLIGTLLVLGRMSADNEITAMRSAGLSILQITRPILALALVGVGLELWINFYVMPQARMDFYAKRETALRETALAFMVPKTFIRDFPNVVIFFDQKDGSEFRNFWLWRLDKQQRVREIIHAESVQMDFDPESTTLWATPKAGTVESRPVEDPERSVQHGAITSLGGTAERIEFPLGEALGKRGYKRKIDWYNLSQLIEEAKRRRESGADAVSQMEVAIVLHSNLTFAVAVFSFALIAIPLGIRTQRRESSANLGVAVLLVVAYYVMIIAAGWLAKRPEWRPDLLLWVPNILFFILGVLMLRKVERA